MIKRLCIKLFAMCVVLLYCTIGTIKYIKADDFDTYDEEAEMNYNIFSSSAWNLSMYAYFGYAFAWMPYFNKSIPYGDMLRNGHHGISFGGGVAINKNILFGLSFEFISKVSHMRNEFSEIYKEIAGIKSEVSMLNIDAGVRMPMGLTNLDLFKYYLDIYVVGGFNIISANLTNRYSSEYDVVPVDIAQTPHEFSLGANLGIALTYKISSLFNVRTEVRRMLIITRKSSLVADSWLFNLGIGIKF